MSDVKRASILNPAIPVLIVDDSMQFASLLRKMLESGLGYQDITHVENTTKAYELIAGSPHHYGVIFIDFRFPDGETGGELLTRLGSEGLLTHSISFLITSEPSSENLKQAKDAGAFGVIAKPFNRDVLRTQLERAEASIAADNIEYF